MLAVDTVYQRGIGVGAEVDGGAQLAGVGVGDFAYFLKGPEVRRQFGGVAFTNQQQVAVRQRGPLRKPDR